MTLRESGAVVSDSVGTVALGWRGIRGEAGLRRKLVGVDGLEPRTFIYIRRDSAALPANRRSVDEK